MTLYTSSLKPKQAAKPHPGTRPNEEKQRDLEEERLRSMLAYPDACIHSDESKLPKIGRYVKLQNGVCWDARGVQKLLGILQKENPEGASRYVLTKDGMAWTASEVEELTAKSQKNSYAVATILLVIAFGVGAAAGAVMALVRYWG